MPDVRERIPAPAPPHAATEVAEMTLKAVAVGIGLGIVFGVANAYIGLRVGMTVSASIPAAVLSVALFAAMRSRATILEANLSQTIGSASTSLSSGTIFTIPALFLWGVVPPYLQIVVLCWLGAVLGLAAMIPLRRMLIVKAHDELPYPEGTACAEVLRATAGGTGGGAWIFRGIALGAAVKLTVALLFLIPNEIAMEVPALPKAILALEVAPALLGVGFILGYRQSAVLVAGSIVSSLVLIPLIAWLGRPLTAPMYPESALTVSAMTTGQIWARYVRYIGAGAVATAGLFTVARSLPTMVGAMAAVARGLRKPDAQPADGGSLRDRDLPGSFVLGGIAVVVAVSAFVPGVFAGGMGLLPRMVCAAGVAVFGVMFVAVAARIVGIVGVSSQPTSGITLVTLLGVATVFAAAGWNDMGARAAVLTVGTIVAVAASKAGDISQDLKTGYLVGATPARQQLGQLLGASAACWAVAGTVMLLGNTYTFGSQQMAAPQAMLMKTIIEGVLAHELPWDLVLTGAGVSISAMLCGVSGLAFAIGVYLPLASMAPIYVGGCLRALAQKYGGAPAEGRSDPGILAASGLVAGEGLMGVLVAVLAGTGVVPKSMDPRIHGITGELVALGVVLLVGYFLVRAGRSARTAA
ncbi:MAG: OPT family oligopeptide transporter [Candidatus Polarisedimenticolia bacterium]